MKIKDVILSLTLLDKALDKQGIPNGEFEELSISENEKVLRLRKKGRTLRIPMKLVTVANAKDILDL